MSKQALADGRWRVQVFCVEVAVWDGGYQWRQITHLFKPGSLRFDIRPVWDVPERQFPKTCIIKVRRGLNTAVKSSMPGWIILARAGKLLLKGTGGMGGGSFLPSSPGLFLDSAEGPGRKEEKTSNIIS